MARPPGALTRRAAMLVAADLTIPMQVTRILAGTGPLRPDGVEGKYKLAGNWVFGTKRPDATTRSKEQLDQFFRYRYIYDNGRLDHLPSYC